MKSLYIVKENRRIQSISEINDFAIRMKVQFPEVLIQLILKYEGAKIHEDKCYFEISPGVFYELNQILYLNKSEIGGASIEQILDGHRSRGILEFIPFGIDSGGWDYNIGIGDKNYGQVWINKFDSGEENSFVFVANSLEEFIDGLKSDV